MLVYHVVRSALYFVFHLCSDKDIGLQTLSTLFALILPDPITRCEHESLIVFEDQNEIFPH